ncbi:uncharacterized protein LOC129747720 [Uranotaenia lowii]|uniref:uncharacterized protein LOC129747720 n=1 Tax=Uranotaenia lowii TaxID=190385 RepID=UPI00247A9589|nr:uncharacterized protein LOC129747720 [Uranotaenia lowii]
MEPILPTEILQGILAFLPLSDLLNASLVCTTWNSAAELLIVRKCRLKVVNEMSDHLRLIRERCRNYRTVRICCRDEWSPMRLIVGELAKKIQPNELVLQFIIENHLFQFYQTFSEWFKHLVSIQICVHDNFSEYYSNTNECFEMCFPMVRFLQWDENKYFSRNKTICLNVPNVESIYFRNSFDETSELKIFKCNHVKRLIGYLNTKDLSQILSVETLSNLEHITLDCGFRQVDFGFLGRIPNLKSLVLVVEKKCLRTLDSIQNLASLEKLHINSQFYSLGDNGVADFTKLEKTLESLKQIELTGFDILIPDTINCPRLKNLKLDNVEIKNKTNNLTIFAPKLNVLSLSISILSRIGILNNNLLGTLTTNVEDTEQWKTRKQDLYQFLKAHNSIRALSLQTTLMKSIIQEFRPLDEALMQIEKLQLRDMTVELDTFEAISKWKSLKHLLLEDCTIQVSGSETMIILPFVKRMDISQYRSKVAPLTKVPIQLVNEKVREKLSPSAAFLMTTHISES